MKRQTYTVKRTPDMIWYRDENGVVVATATPGSDMDAFIATGISASGCALKDESGQFLIGQRDLIQPGVCDGP
jgi:hypothetical protein